MRNLRRILLGMAAMIGFMASTFPAMAAPTVNVVATDPNAAEMGRDPAVFTVTRSGAAFIQSLSIMYTVAGTSTNGTDYDLLSGSLTIPAGQASATITVRPVDDPNAEEHETVYVQLKPAAQYTIGANRTAAGMIVDNDTIVTVSAPDSMAAEQGRDPGVFLITRSGGSLAQAMVVAYSMTGTSTNGTDYTRLPGTATIAAGQTTTTINLVPVDDSTADADETAILTLASRINYRIGTPASATIRIADNDQPAPLKPVLMVIANQDFYYREYAETRESLVLAGIPVAVAAAQKVQSFPHANSGQGSDGGVVMPDLELGSANAADYSAIVFVGGWGASSYQYAFSGTYANAAYNGSNAVRTKVNQLINDFRTQGKHVTAICHGVTVLAWARVNNVSLLQGRSVCGYHGTAPQSNVPGSTTSEWHIQQNGGTMFPSGSIGNPATVADDVWVDGKIITAENFDSARRFGQVIAQQLLNQ